MSFKYKTEQWLPYPVETVFAFFADPDNLPSLMPPWQKARIEKASIVPPPHPLGSPGPVPPAAGAGSRIILSFRPFPLSPVRLRWEAEISEFAWNRHFLDRQVSGPFASWIHSHSLRAVDREGFNVTVIVDQVEYDLPMGFAGKVAHRLFLQRRIEQTFVYRQGRLAEILAKGRRFAPQSQSEEPQQGKLSA